MQIATMLAQHQTSNKKKGRKHEYETDQVIGSCVYLKSCTGVQATVKIWSSSRQDKLSIYNYSEAGLDFKQLT